MYIEHPAPEGEKCDHCGTEAEYVRTREHETEDSRVWMCRNPECDCHKLYFHTRTAKRPITPEMKARNELWDYFYANHRLTLVETEMNDVLAAVEKYQRAAPVPPLGSEVDNQLPVGTATPKRYRETDEILNDMEKIITAAKQIPSLTDEQRRIKKLIRDIFEHVEVEGGGRAALASLEFDKAVPVIQAFLKEHAESALRPTLQALAARAEDAERIVRELIDHDGVTPSLIDQARFAELTRFCKEQHAELATLRTRIKESGAFEALEQYLGDQPGMPELPQAWRNAFLRIMRGRRDSAKSATSALRALGEGK